jgi:hypothetical protein
MAFYYSNYSDEVLLISFQGAGAKDSSGCSAMVCINLNGY